MPEANDCFTIANILYPKFHQVLNVRIIPPMTKLLEIPVPNVDKQTLNFFLVVYTMGMYTYLCKLWLSIHSVSQFGLNGMYWNIETVHTRPEVNEAIHHLRSPTDKTYHKLISQCL